jgi:hypothetical protein
VTVFFSFVGKNLVALPKGPLHGRTIDQRSRGV